MAHWFRTPAGALALGATCWRGRWGQFRGRCRCARCHRGGAHGDAEPAALWRGGASSGAGHFGRGGPGSDGARAVRGEVAKWKHRDGRRAGWCGIRQHDVCPREHQGQRDWRELRRRCDAHGVVVERAALPRQGGFVDGAFILIQPGHGGGFASDGHHRRGLLRAACAVGQGAFLRRGIRGGRAHLGCTRSSRV